MFNRRPPPAPPPLPATSPAEPMRLRWMWNDLIAADGHRLAVAFSATFRPLPDAAERQLFRETFGPSPAGQSSAAITDYFANPLRTAAVALASSQPAAAMLAEDLRSRWIESLRTAAQTIAFACGIEVLAPYAVEVTSPSLRQQQLEQMQRSAADRQSADRLKQVQQAGQLLQQWEALRASSPLATAGKLLDQVNAADRAQVLRTLLLASAEQSAPTPLWVVAGQQLLKVPTDAAEPQLHIAPLPSGAAELGPLRSVAVDAARLLMGAQRGIIVAEAADPSQGQCYLHPDLNSEHGFTRAVFAWDGLWAVHRDAGLVHWRQNAPDHPAQCISVAQLGGVPRLPLRSLDQRFLLLAVNNSILGVSANGELRTLATAPVPVLALLHCQDRLVVVSEDGTVALHDANTFEPQTTSRPAANRLAAAALLPWLNSARLLLAACDGPLYSVGVDDELVMQYAGPTAGFRGLAATAAAVAALSPDRQRIILWHPWDGRRPVADLYVASIARHRVADLAF